MIAWFATRRQKLILIGAGIFILITAVIYLLDFFMFKSIGIEMVIFISLLLSGTAYCILYLCQESNGNFDNLSVSPREHIFC